MSSFLDLQRVQGAPSYLFLMYLFKNKTELELDDESIVTITRLLINFFIRRNLTDTPPTRDLTRLFMSFIEGIEQNDYKGTTVFDNLRSKLISVSASDEFFSEKLHGPVYDENSGACRFILCMMAQAGMTQETYVDLWRQYDSKQYVWSIELQRACDEQALNALQVSVLVLLLCCIGAEVNKCAVFEHGKSLWV